jgi:Bacterial DNA-binding protein
LTGRAILGTFRTSEGLPLIKSELVDRISLQNRHLHRHEAERIVNIIFSEITAAMVRRDRVELRGFGTFLSSSGKAGLDEILAQGLWFRSEERPFHSSGAGRE